MILYTYPFSLQIFYFSAARRTLRNINFTHIFCSQLWGLWIHHVITAFILVPIRKRHIKSQNSVKWIYWLSATQRTSEHLFTPFSFLLPNVCTVYPSALFSLFFCSFSGLPFSLHFFYPCKADTSVCISFLCIQNQLSMAQNTKVEEQRNAIMAGQYPALERLQNKLWYVMNQYTVAMATFRDHIWPCYHGILPLRNGQTRVFAAWAFILPIKPEYQVLNSLAAPVVSLV